MHILKLMRSLPRDYTDIQPYIFSPETDLAPEHLSLDDGDILASPFAKFSIELSNDKPLTSDEVSNSFRTMCLYCEERGPDDYFFAFDMYLGERYQIFTVDSDRLTAWQDGKILREQSSGDVYLQYRTLAKHYIERMHSRKFGLVNRAGKAKFKDSAGRKQQYIPKDVIYCSQTPKKSKGEPVQSLGRERVRWLESWSVTAHWRPISPDSLGKDRAGERVVKGRTFVGEYYKGKGRAFLRARVVK